MPLRTGQQCFDGQLYPGDPEINAQRWFANPVTNDCEALVQSLLGS